MTESISNATGNLEILDSSEAHCFSTPSKKIHDEPDVSFWLTSYAYKDITTFILQLNVSMFPRSLSHSNKVETWELNGSNIVYSSTVQSLRRLLSELEAILDETPPDPGPRRFGNISYRKWYGNVEARIDALLDEHLPPQVLNYPAEDRPAEEAVSAKDELKTYLLGSFGSAQRLDYGTGHELSFLAFLGGIWKLGGFSKASPGVEERAIVLGVIEPYLHLIRRLILTYTLEPAGSHGVWGLDDHSFLPYLFGSAQYSPAIISPTDIPTEGSLPDSPRPGDVTKQMTISRERKTNMYFSAIGFIYDVKTGPFWEHSPILFDISGVKAGWAKINKGMMKMYNAEVLSKFPVIQHFPFGSLFKWEKDPNAQIPPPIIHATNVPPTLRSLGIPLDQTSMRAPPQDPGTRVTIDQRRSTALPGPKSSWTGQSGASGMPATRAPWASASDRPTPQLPVAGGRTVAPWTSATTKPPVPNFRSTLESRAAAPWARPAPTRAITEELE